MAAPTRAPKKLWYYELHGRSVGPVPESDLKLLAENGTLKPDARVWSEGMPGWEAALAIVPRAFEDAELPGERWGLQHVIAAILATCAAASLVILGVVAFRPSEDDAGREVAKAEADPTRTPTADPGKVPVAVGPSIPVTEPGPGEPPAASGPPGGTAPEVPANPAPPVDPTPAPMPPTPGGPPTAGHTGFNPPAPAGRPPANPPGGSFPRPPGKGPMPGRPFGPGSTPPTAASDKGTVRLTTKVAITPGVECWVYVDEKRTAQWRVGTTEVEFTAPAGKREVKIVSTYRGQRVEIYKNAVEVAADKVKEIEVIPGKK